jgi:hypothetical protein
MAHRGRRLARQLRNGSKKAFFIQMLYVSGHLAREPHGRLTTFAKCAA